VEIMASISPVAGKVSTCTCRFEGCKRPMDLVGKASDGRTVVYPSDSEEARLWELVNKVWDEIQEAWECEDEAKATALCSPKDSFSKRDCLVCKQTFDSIDLFVGHCEYEAKVLSERVKELLSSRQKLAGKCGLRIQRICFIIERA
jgi:hypothetical protein